MRVQRYDFYFIFYDLSTCFCVRINYFLHRLFNYNRCPAMLVLHGAILNATQSLVEFS